MVEWPAITVIVGIASAVGGFLGSHFLQKSRIKYEVMTKHFDAIKSEVIKPIVNQFESYYIPVLERRLSPITNTSRSIPQDVVIDSSTKIEYEYTLKALSYESFLEQLHFGSIGLPAGLTVERSYMKIDSTLFEDSQSAHFAHIFQKRSAFIETYNKFLEKCVQTALKLESEVLLQLQIPKYQPSLPEYVQSERVAQYVFDFQMGTTRYAPIVHESEEKIILGVAELMKGNQEQRHRFKSYIVERLGKELPEVTGLKQEANNLLEVANSILKDFKGIQKMAKLRGKCRFVDV